jgi:hypothetical protein
MIKKNKLLLLTVALLMSGTSLLLSCKKNTGSLEQDPQNQKAFNRKSFGPNVLNERQLAATPLEYQQASQEEKGELDQFQTAFDALSTVADGGVNFIFQKTTMDIIDGPTEPIDPVGGVCKVCGTFSAMGCISGIKSYMDKNNLTTLSVTAKRIRVDGKNCVEISYKQVVIVTPTDPWNPTDPGPTNPVEKYVINPNTGTPVINPQTGEGYDIRYFELDVNPQTGQPIYDPNTMQPLVRLRIVQTN